MHAAGQMGGGIAQLAAMKGLDVILCDMHSAALERSIATTNGSLKRLVGKQQLTQEQADSAASRICRATDMQANFHLAERWQRVDTQEHALDRRVHLHIVHQKPFWSHSLHSQECLLQVLPHQMFPLASRYLYSCFSNAGTRAGRLHNRSHQ